MNDIIRFLCTESFMHRAKAAIVLSVYTSQGTMEQLLVSRSVQLLNREEEVASIWST